MSSSSVLTAPSAEVEVEALDVELVRSRERLYSMYLDRVSMNSLAASASFSSVAPLVVKVFTLRKNDRPQLEQLCVRGSQPAGSEEGNQSVAQSVLPSRTVPRCGGSATVTLPLLHGTANASDLAGDATTMQPHLRVPFRGNVLS